MRLMSDPWSRRRPWPQSTHASLWARHVRRRGRPHPKSWGTEAAVQRARPLGTATSVSTHRWNAEISAAMDGDATLRDGTSHGVARSEVVDSAVSPPHRCSSSFVLSILFATGKFGSRGAHDGAAAPRRCVCAGGRQGLVGLLSRRSCGGMVFSRCASGQRVGATVGQWVVAG